MVKKEALLNEQSQTEESTEDVSPDFCEGLIRMLSSLYGHTASNVLSSTMAAKLLADESRFCFSHELGLGLGASTDRTECRASMGTILFHLP